MSEQDPDLAQPLRIAGVEIPVQDQSPLVLLLVALVQKQAAEIQELSNERKISV